MKSIYQRFFFLFFIILFFCYCEEKYSPVRILREFPLDKIDGVISRNNVEIDKKVSSDGHGSLKINATRPVALQLFETGDLDVEDAQLIYQAKLKTENLEGNVYIEMWMVFTGKGEFFSKSLQAIKTGTMDWSTSETPFFLKKGENPDNIKLNLVITGKGTVWIDEMKLLKAPLPEME
jgi:hypothetical protein